MAQQLLTQQGAFTDDSLTKVNDNFSELYASTAGGTLTSAHLLVGNSSNVATDRAVTGDVTISNTGVTAIKSSVTLTTPNIGAATGTSVVLSGDCKAATYHVGSTAGASGTGTTITAITVVNGIVTAITVS